MTDLVGAPLSPAQTSTPKRKRNLLSTDHNESPIQCSAVFSFEVPAVGGDDGNSSPRTKVVQKFQGLAIDSGGGAPQPSSEVATATGEGDKGSDGVRTVQVSPTPGRDNRDQDFAMRDEDDEDDNQQEFTARKRLKFPGHGPGSRPELNSFGRTASIFTPIGGGTVGEWATDLQATPGGDPKRNTTAAKASRCPADTRSRGKQQQRTGTPPLVATKTTAGGGRQKAIDDGEWEDIPAGSGDDGDDEDEEQQRHEPVDPVRAALTWREDEITVYDPEDEDDDGTGINGIGFKPTPAIAHARTLKRRQQLAEYRKREEREARARRSQRRGRASPASARGGGGGSGGGVGSSSAAATAAVAAVGMEEEGRRVRRVRFMEVEPAAVIMT